MSTAVWPPIPHDELIREEERSLARELEWLLSELQETLRSLKAGLEECASLLAPQEPGSTLVLSSLRSENLKGFITRVGTRVVKGDVSLKLPSLKPPPGATTNRLSISQEPTAPTLVLQQLVSVRTLINACLDVVDASIWTGDSRNADFMSGQLQLLHENMQEARQALKGGSDVQKPWFEDPVDEKSFHPQLPPYLSFHLEISEAALLLQVRTLETTNPAAQNKSLTGLSIREQLAVALGGTRTPTHEEANEVFMYKGEEVRVKEKVRVESQDPSLMAAFAKLSALEHSVALSRKALDVVMGRED
ncbi:hypothetical protein EV356DRAFT_385472 [Viridothelium virens]|uniref:RAVE subunit 2/Rogdi n=1 Tax=Viridothelium virens TaxID=1048519 RepID=A0A6A6GUP2_VIRVR|nr:hypothetical protein EV356DRAFT_385472 [Viridothelium virens]